MIAPVILLYTFVIIYPLANMVFTSFFEWNGFPPIRTGSWEWEIT